MEIVDVYRYHLAGREYMDRAEAWLKDNGVDPLDVFEFALLDDGTVRIRGYIRYADGKLVVNRDHPTFGPVTFENIIHPKTLPPIPA